MGQGRSGRKRTAPAAGGSATPNTNASSGMTLRLVEHAYNLDEAHDTKSPWNGSNAGREYPSWLRKWLPACARLSNPIVELAWAGVKRQVGRPHHVVPSVQSTPCLDRYVIKSPSARLNPNLTRHECLVKMKSVPQIEALGG